MAGGAARCVNNGTAPNPDSAAVNRPEGYMQISTRCLAEERTRCDHLSNRAVASLTVSR